MKKLWLVVALVAWGGLAVNTFADVQNIRLSGDVRIRGYYLNGTDVNPNNGHNGLDEAFISQRTRVSVEADLEDHVLVVVTLKAEGDWGQSNDTSDSSGAGTANTGGSDDKINRSWDVGVTEAYVQFNELFYTAATLKLGRQYLHYGRGLIISSVEQEYNYDAARLVLDYYPLTIDIVGAQLVNNQSFGGASSHAGSADLLFINGRYEMSDSAIKNIEMYFGWIAQGSSGPITSTTVPPTVNSGSPMIIGARADLNLAEPINSFIEGAYEFGSDGTPNTDNLSAYIVNLGFRLTLKDTQWSPVFNFGNTIASGGGNGNVSGVFVPWFDYLEGYNGYLFCPALANIQIINAGASIKPYENTTLSVQGYFYRKIDKDGPAGSNVNYDWGGPTWSAAASGVNSRELGWEIDGILGYDYSKDVRMQLVYGVFLPENAYQNAGFSVAAQEVRAEVNVKF